MPHVQTVNEALGNADPETTGKRRSRKARMAARKAGPSYTSGPVRPGFEGGQYKPLSDAEVQRLHEASLDILENFGVAGPTDAWRERVVAAGGWMKEDRLCFPKSLVEDCIAKAGRNFTLYGRREDFDIDLSGKRTYFAGATAAIKYLDPHTGKFRQTTLKDLYDMVRLADALENVHFVQRPIIARDEALANSNLLDVNTAYAATAATGKHIISTFFEPEAMHDAVGLCDLSVGGDGDGAAFLRRPFMSTTCTIVVSPLRFSQESCELADAAVNVGLPLTVATVPQSGATSPVTLAGTIAMGNAEALAGFVALNLLKPGCQLTFKNWPFVSDLRTGAFAGGGAELGLMMAGVAQMAHYYDIPSSCACGMTSAKIPDAQSGWEKGNLSTLAALAGCNLIMMTMGGLADNVAYSPEALIIDESMVSGAIRSVRGIEVNEDALAMDSIQRAISGPGHFLGDSLTIERMESEFVYPDMADRKSIDEWMDEGANDIRERARAKMFKLLDTHFPDHIATENDDRIRDRFDIQLPREDMGPNG
jgi:trimethylamine--corrinoid protein Co-methyltransferase